MLGSLYKHILFTFLWVTLLAQWVIADESTHLYNTGEKIIVWVDSVRPSSNIQESYPFFQLPYCRGEDPPILKHETLAKALMGEHLVSLGNPIHFLADSPVVALCNTTLTFEQLSTFHTAIQQKYRFNFYIDDLPLWENIGTLQSSQTYLYTRFDFYFEYNNNQIITANLSLNKPVLMDPQSSKKDALLPLTFEYSTKFVETDALFKDRFKRLLNLSFFEQKIHWFSMVNSIFLVFVLVGTVFFILSRALRRDFARYESEDIFDLDRDLDDYGWKLVHSDVFRAPPNLSFFSALLGSGIQFATLSAIALVVDLLDAAYTKTGDTLSIAIAIYVLSSLINGYISCGHFAMYGGKGWLYQALFSASLIPFATCICFFVLNTIATSYMSSRVVPFFSVLSLAALFFFLILPLTLMGAILGKRFTKSGFPCRANPIPRPIPERNWHSQPYTLVFLGGLLPFSSIVVELNYLISSFFGYNVYYAYGFTLVALFSVLCTCGCCSIVSTYIFLNAEDHRWHWISFGASASTSLYIFLYASYYYFFRSGMYGLFQFAFFFGHVLMGCICTFLMLGSVGYYASSLFVRRIYSSIKID